MSCESCELYREDLAAITRTMDLLEYPYDPEYPNRDETIRRLHEEWNTRQHLIELVRQADELLKIVCVPPFFQERYQHFIEDVARYFDKES